MSEEPKSIWKKSWKWPDSFLDWVILLVGLPLVTAAFLILIFDHGRFKADADIFWFVAGFCLLIILLALFIRWVCCWKNFRRFLFGLACFITLIALFYAEEDWRGKHDWEKFKHKWEAKGEKFDWQSIVPPPVPNDENFAMTPIWVESMKAELGPRNSSNWFGSYAENGRTNFVNRLAMPLAQNEDSPTNCGNWQKAQLADLKPWQNYYRVLAVKTNLFPVAPQLQTPAQDVLTALSKYDSTIEELRQASQLPYSQFPLDYNRDDKWAILLPHLAPLKHCALVLQLRAVAELQNGESEKALDDVKLMLRLSDSIRTEPFLISHLVRIAIVQITLQPIYEGLAEHKWSDAQLAELNSELAKLDFLADYEFSMRGERDFDISAVEFLRHRNLRHFREFFGDNNIGNNAQIATIVTYLLCPNGWFCQNEVGICRFYANWYLSAVNETKETVSPATIKAAGQALDTELHRRSPENFLESWLLPMLGAATRRFSYGQESVDLARVAIALERCHLAYGEYPKSLDALAPQFMEKIPHDIIGGQPLHYRKTSDGQFVLYSVGWNERDDGGVVVLLKGPSPGVDVDKGDWVWRYPAK